MPHILVVEDDDDLREAIQQILIDRSFSVAAVRNGVEALAEISNGPLPHCIVLDLMMPAFSGWEFLAELRARDHFVRTPVLVASALAPPPDGIAVQGYIQKPFDADDFVRNVQQLIEVPAA